MASKDVHRFDRLQKTLQELTTEDIKIGSINNAEFDLMIKDVKFNLHKPDLGDEYFTQSPFGYKGQTLIDETVRRSKEIALTNKTVKGLTSLSLLGQKICTTVTAQKLLYCIPYKLLKYGVGDFFETHTDTRTSECLVKTLVLHLPSKGVEGGELMFNGTYKPNDSFDRTRDVITYTLFDIKLAHSVTPVTKGERYAITFKVYDYQRLQVRIAQTSMCIGSANFDEIANDVNVLIVYSDLNIIEEALLQRNMPHIRVYFPHTDESEDDIRVVYDQIKEELSDAELNDDEYTFDDIKQGQQYIVTKTIDVGYPSVDEVSYTRAYGYTGNEADQFEEEEVKYHVGLLLNPEPRSYSEPESKRPCYNLKHK